MRANTSNRVGCRPLLYDSIRGLLLQLRQFLFLLQNCKPSTVFQGLCVDCGLRMNDDFGTAFNYMQRGLRFSNDEIPLLDLDRTLLHTRAFEKLTSEELHLKKQTDENVCNGSLYYLDHGFLVKLRPFVRTFLKQASTMFEMYVAKFLDPESKYFFNSRFITREDINQIGQEHKKSLDLVLGDKRGIVVLDDTKTGW
ncbi:hypothetical protein ACOSP7_024376 [Xanthoceras sorbifolium]